MKEVSNFLEIGYYGKLPAYGDFIQKRLAQDFINVWHEWLQSGMLAAREREPDNWLSYYLNCPAWCFVLSAGICGEQAVTGVTIPSVDKVGRYFNFTLACMLPQDAEATSFAAQNPPWFTALRDLALAALDEEMEQPAIESAISAQGLELEYQSPSSLRFESDAEQLRVVYPHSTSISVQLPGLLHNLIQNRVHQNNGLNQNGEDQYGLWWHNGSSQVSSQSLICTGMPSSSAYLKLLMDEDVLPAPEVNSQNSDIDYLDELLSS